jgi:microcystin-dependent protein
MATTSDSYTGNGSTVLYSFTFPYLDTADVKVSLNGVATTNFTFEAEYQIRFNVAPANAVAIKIYRETPSAQAEAEFYPGSAIRASDLNNNFLQTLYVSQETQDVVASSSSAGLQTQITAANNTANIAITTANSASTTANGIASTANTALANSSSAVTQAGNAVTTANAASATANAISTVATSAQTTANTAQTTANTAQTAANAAQATANTAITNAATAQSTANSAFVPAGAVAYFAMNTAPSGYLKANGAAISRSTYATLFAAIGTTFGNGDGSTTFNLPDLRGEFIRGWDDSRGVDSGRAFGSAQTDDLKSHTHTYGLALLVVGAGTGGSVQRAISGSSTTNSTGGTETRPRNIALLACIKF